VGRALSSGGEASDKPIASQYEEALENDETQWKAHYVKQSHLARTLFPRAKISAYFNK
jgi:hypothetical protein